MLFTGITTCKYLYRRTQFHVMILKIRMTEIMLLLRMHKAGGECSSKKTRMNQKHLISFRIGRAAVFLSTIANAAINCDHLAFMAE